MTLLSVYPSPLILLSTRSVSYQGKITISHSQRRWHYATNKLVAGSKPDEVIGFFYLPHPSSRTMALRSTHNLTAIC
jgi:hypothetical protein